jgi:hypothetical protein
MYGEFMDIPLGDEIERRHNGDAVVAAAEEQEKPEVKTEGE